ncbi:hypothetical protein Tco_0521841 [Tanacetum coccineum]
MAKEIEIITIISDSSSDNSNLDSDNNNSDSCSTSQISTSEEIVYSSPECKGPYKSLLKWYGYLSYEYKDKDRLWGSKSGGNKSNAKPSFSDISKAKACILAKASESSLKAKTFGVKIPPTITCAKEKKRKKKIEEIIVLSSDSSDYNKGVPKEGPNVASVPEEGPSIQGLLDWYGYDTVEEYLSDTYFPSTDKDTKDKDSTDEDTIHESYYPMSKGKYVPTRQRGKEMFHMEADHVVVKAKRILGFIWKRKVSYLKKISYDVSFSQIQSRSAARSAASGGFRWLFYCDGGRDEDEVCDVIGVFGMCVKSIFASCGDLEVRLAGVALRRGLGGQSSCNAVASDWNDVVIVVVTTMLGGHGGSRLGKTMMVVLGLVVVTVVSGGRWWVGLVVYGDSGWGWWCRRCLVVVVMGTVGGGDDD